MADFCSPPFAPAPKSHSAFLLRHLTREDPGRAKEGAPRKRMQNKCFSRSLKGTVPPHMRNRESGLLLRQRCVRALVYCVVPQVRSCRVRASVGASRVSCPRSPPLRISLWFQHSPLFTVDKTTKGGEGEYRKTTALRRVGETAARHAASHFFAHEKIVTRNGHASIGRTFSRRRRYSHENGRAPI